MFAPRAWVFSGADSATLAAMIRTTAMGAPSPASQEEHCLRRAGNRIRRLLQRAYPGVGAAEAVGRPLALVVLPAVAASPLSRLGQRHHFVGLLTSYTGMSHPSAEVGNDLIQTAIGYLLLSGPGLFLHRAWPLTYPPVGSARLLSETLWYGLAVGLGARGLMIMGGESAGGYCEPGSLAQWVGAVAASAVIPSVVEEYVFRGHLYSRLACVLPPHLTIVATSLIFTAVHWDGEGLLGQILIDLLFGVVRHRSRHILPCIAAHFGWNLAVMCG